MSDNSQPVNKAVKHHIEPTEEGERPSVPNATHVVIKQTIPKLQHTLQGVMNIVRLCEYFDVIV